MRSIKPEFWADQDLAVLSRDTRLMYVGLWNLADEHGRLRGDPRYVKGQLFPYDDDLSAEDDVEDMLRCLAEDGKVVRYVVAGAAYLYLPNLAKHQRLESEKVPSRLPPPPSTDKSRSARSPRAKKSAPDSNESAPRAKDHALKHVAGSREHVAGSREHVDSREQVRAEFDDFWAAYPRREAKADARKAWDKAINRGDSWLIVAGAVRYRDDPGRDPKFTAHAATWLNGDRWGDDPLPMARAPNGYVERDGLRVTAKTAAHIDGRARWVDMPDQLAIEGQGP